MKKAIILAAMIAASAAQAVTINWGTGMGIFTLDGTTQITSQTYAQYKLALEMWVVDGGAEGEDISVWRTTTPSFTTKGVPNLAMTTTQIMGWTASDVFYIRAFATFDGVDYYMDIWKGGENGVVGEGWSYTGDWANPTLTADWCPDFANTRVGGEGVEGDVGRWISTVPVPEPASAGLALAGLALLFRRKRSK